ncbi:MAG: hypothetical protein LBI19_05670, partial [Oscillospiraceae bacterium]|nr:hypothetical protein [Oscillospiraceae bacterium]
WSAELLREKFNVNITIINDNDGTFVTRMEARDLGDIVLFGNNGKQYLEAIEAGLLFDWEEDDLAQEYGPYVWENMQLALETNRKISGGTIYGYGYDVAASAGSIKEFIYYPYVRWDLYQQLGYPEIKTLEDFIPLLEDMVALEPYTDKGQKTYGVSMFPDWDGAMVMMVKSTAALYGYEEFHMGLYDQETQTFQGCLEEGGQYLRALKFYNTLNQKGLLDPDSQGQTFDQATAKYLNGQSMFNIFTFVAESFNSEENQAAGKSVECIAANDQLNIVAGLAGYGGNRVWAIGANTAYPELCMEIINWLSTPEGVLSYNYGPKGVTWDYDEEGNTYMTDLGLQAQDNKETTTIEYGGWRGAYKDGEFQHNLTSWSRDAINPESALGETFNFQNWASTMLNKPVTPIRQSWRDHYDAIRGDDYLVDRGLYSITVQSTYSEAKRSSELETIYNQVKESIKANSWSAIYAKSDEEYDAIVAKMIAEAKGFGYDELVEWSIEEAVRRKAAEEEALGKK